jgi:predicted RNA binding protein YcfA (HicA-like mRNA interferase family)
MKVGQVIRVLQADGWYVSRTSGSHRQYKHANKPGLVTVAGKPSAELPPKTLASIRKQAQLEDLR